MVTVVTAPAQYPTDGFKVYLAGAIDMGSAENWQQYVIKRLAHEANLILLNPRREFFTSEMEVEQIEWELKAMEDSNQIMIWFPASSKAPISLLELGLFVRSGKLLVGIENGYYRQKNVEITSRRYGAPIFYSLDEVIEAIKRLLRKST